VGIGRPVDPRGPAPVLRASARRVPFLPAPPHARFDGWRRLELVGRAVDFAESIDWDYAGEGPLWSYHLHQFDYLRAPALAPHARRALMLDWIARHPEGTGWDPHPISLRTFSWAKLLATPGALALGGDQRERVGQSMARQIETLSRNLEVRLQANHLLSNLMAVVLGGLLFEGPAADAWSRHEEKLRRELAAQVLEDGTHYERSPMYHALLLENVLDLLNFARASDGSRARAGEPLLTDLAACARRMLGAQRVWLHPDGEIALLADSALGVAQPAGQLERYAEALDVVAEGPAREGVLDRGGYLRIGSDPMTLIASVSGPMPAHQPGHAHCDALSFELSCAGQRVVCDTGLYEYIPGPLRDLSRSTRSHATMEVAGAEQAELWAAHRIGGRPEVALHAVEPGRRAEASCASWSTRDSVHRRVFEAREGAVEITDSLEGVARPVRLMLPLAVGLEPTLVCSEGGESGDHATIRLSGGPILRIDLPEGLRWRVERAPYFPEFGRRLERACLVGEGEGFRSGRWRFELIS